MIRRFLETLKKILPPKVVKVVFSLKPDIHAVNIYILKDNTPIVNLHPIDEKYAIRQLTIDDSEKLKGFYRNYKHILPRLKKKAWVGLAVVDTTNDAIAYVSWVIRENIQFINDFNITMSDNQFMVIHGFCDPKYRHQGLHTRMEQERLNYCFRNGAEEIWVHIASKNERGIATLINAGYKFHSKSRIIRIPIFGIHRRLKSALKNPFKKMI